MARLDVHPMPGKGRDGYLLDVQANLLGHLATRIVVPLLPEDAAPKPISELNPVFEYQATSGTHPWATLRTQPPLLL